MSFRQHQKPYGPSIAQGGYAGFQCLPSGVASGVVAVEAENQLRRIAKQQVGMVGRGGGA